MSIHPKDCTCPTVRRGQQHTPDQDKVCWNWLHNPKLRKAWGGDDNVIPVEGGLPPERPRVGKGGNTGPKTDGKPKRKRLCKLLGPEVDVVGCKSCNQKAGVEGKGEGFRVKVFSCPVHSRCTIKALVEGAHVCEFCPDYVDPLHNPDAGQVRHLLFHLWPSRSNDNWRWHLEQLRQRQHLFNGRRICALMVDDPQSDAPPQAEPASLVRELAGDLFDEVIELVNDPTRREVASFEPLFSRVQSLDPSEVILYAQGKGAGRTAHKTVRRWTEGLYRLYCDHWPLVQKLLRDKPLAGAFKKVGQCWKPEESLSTWHYSGSWFWVRSADLFARKDWRRIDQFWGGIEPYPSLHFDAEDAATIFWEAPGPNVNLYELNYWDGVIQPALDAWLAERKKEEALGRAAPPGLKIELGGGRNPRGKPWINVDCVPGPTVDHIANFETDRLPFEDESVGEVYSCHAFEHVRNLSNLLREIARVCKPGARFELRVPHPLSPMAMCAGHVHVIAPEQIDHWCRAHVADWWTGSPRRLAHLSTEQVPGGSFGEAKALHPSWTPDQVMRFVPGAAHEVKYVFEVIPHDE